MESWEFELKRVITEETLLKNTEKYVRAMEVSSYRGSNYRKSTVFSALECRRIDFLLSWKHVIS